MAFFTGFFGSIFAGPVFTVVFGGCTVSIVEDGAIDAFKKQVGEAYKEKIGYDCTFYTVEIGGGPAVI